MTDPSGWLEDCSEATRFSGTAVCKSADCARNLIVHPHVFIQGGVRPVSLTGRAFVSAILLLVAGCAVGPDFRRPAAPEVTGYTPEALPSETVSARVGGGAAQRFAPGA